jgi:RNA polymerase sigma-70 factor, ECF subfamily
VFSGPRAAHPSDAKIYTSRSMLRLVRLVRPRVVPRLGAEDELRPLAEAANDGDVVALRTLLTVLAPQILRVVRRVLGHGHPDVEDVAQECAVELVGALRRFRGESSVHHFACRVVLQSAMNARRKLGASKRAPPEGPRFDADEVADIEPDVESRVLCRASIELLRQLCDELPAAQSEALALHLVLGHTVTEIAAICEAPLETVRSRLRAARIALTNRALHDPRLRELVEENS